MFSVGTACAEHKRHMLACPGRRRHMRQHLQYGGAVVHGAARVPHCRVAELLILHGARQGTELTLRPSGRAVDVISAAGWEVSTHFRRSNASPGLRAAVRPFLTGLPKQRWLSTSGCVMQMQVRISVQAWGRVNVRVRVGVTIMARVSMYTVHAQRGTLGRAINLHPGDAWVRCWGVACSEATTSLHQERVEQSHIQRTSPRFGQPHIIVGSPLSGNNTSHG